MPTINQARPVWGADAPPHTTGRYYPPTISFTLTATGLTTTATRLYYVPYLITEIRSYAGFVLRNTGASDSGKKIRTGLYLMRTGGLVKAATELSLTGAAADNVVADAFTPGELGWHWICAHFETNPDVKAIRGVGQVNGAAGYSPPNMAAGMFGVFSATADLMGTSTPAAWYVDTAYGALASTMVTPTATTTEGPWLALKA